MKIQIDVEIKLKEFLQKQKFVIRKSHIWNEPNLWFIKWHDENIYSEDLIDILKRKWDRINFKDKFNLAALKFVRKFKLLNKIHRFKYKHFPYSDESYERIKEAHPNWPNMIINDNIRNSIKVIAMTEKLGRIHTHE